MVISVGWPDKAWPGLDRAHWLAWGGVEVQEPARGSESGVPCMHPFSAANQTEVPFQLETLASHPLLVAGQPASIAYLFRPLANQEKVV